MLAVTLLGILALAAAKPHGKSARWYPDCGKSKYEDAAEVIPLIVGGQPSRPNEFPWQVSIRSRLGSHYCGGVVVHPRWVVTAAHCTIGESNDNIVVVVGDHLRTSVSPEEATHQTERYFIHEEYEAAAQFDSDISIIKTRTEISFNENVTAICPPIVHEDYDGELGEASGWGTLRPGGALPNELYWVKLPIISNALCDSEMGGGITDTMICAGDVPNDEVDTCQGDSGGPLSVKKNGTFELIGLTSWGYGCASGTPGVYTRVSEFVQWIQDKIDKN